MAAPEAPNGPTIEYLPAVMEEVRRLAVDGLMAFGHGGLEAGGVLYGARDENRVSILGSAELCCEHIFGPGFVLSDNDRKALARLIEPPEGLETVGWYRAHTRNGLDLDVSDRELFDQFAAKEKIVGLVLKPTRLGLASAALYVRDTTGAILPSAASEFTIEPLGRQPAAIGESSPVADAEGSAASAIVAGPEPAAAVVSDAAALEGIPRNEAYQLLAERPRHRIQRAMAAAAVLGIAACAIYWRSRPARNPVLEAHAIAPGQVRIEWNLRSLSAVDSASAVLQIRDGESAVTIPLDANQLRSGSITYKQSSGHIAARLRVERRQRGAGAAEASIEFVGAPEPKPRVAIAEVPPGASGATLLKDATPQNPPLALATPPAEVRDQAKNDEHGHLQAKLPREPTPQKPAHQAHDPAHNDEHVRRQAGLPQEPTPTEPAHAAKREFRLSPTGQKTLPAAVAALPAPPASPALATGGPVLPDFLSQTPHAAPISRPYSGPRSGRLIWTGELGRRGVVEIEGTRASIGTLTGSLSGVPAVFHVWPAEFTREGLVVYTLDGAEHGHKEPPSKSNGWNAVNFQFDPERARELVVLEAPNHINNFNRLVVRNDARACPIIVVDWTVK